MASAAMIRLFRAPLPPRRRTLLDAIAVMLVGLAGAGYRFLAHTIVLTEKATYPTFTAAYPALAHHIATHYRPVGDTQRDTHTITIYAERSRMSKGRDTESGWECCR